MTMLVVEHENDCPAGLLAVPLGPARVVRPYRGETLPPVEELTGLVVLGGSMGALEDDVAPWLPAVRALLADAVRRSVPTFGVCLGAQLLAAACGGRVERGADGPEDGVVRVRALDVPDPWVDALPADGLVATLHDDVVSELPPDAELLATGDTYPHQMFRVGSAAWGVQYHPEVTADTFAGWLRDREPEPAAGVRADLAAHPGVVGRQSTADAHARALLSAVTVLP